MIHLKVDKPSIRRFLRDSDKPFLEQLLQEGARKLLQAAMLLQQNRFILAHWRILSSLACFYPQKPTQLGDESSGSHVKSCLTIVKEIGEREPRSRPDGLQRMNILSACPGFLLSDRRFRRRLLAHV
jgi:hypothetical protein